MTPPRQHGSYGTRANPRGCLQTVIASIFAIVTVLQRTVAQSITIKSAACNFSPFAGNPMTELVAIRVAGSAYFMVGSQDQSGKHTLLDSDCNVGAELPPVFPTGNTNAGFHGQGGPFPIDTLIFRGVSSASSVSRIRMRRSGQSIMPEDPLTSTLTGTAVAPGITQYSGMLSNTVYLVALTGRIVEKIDSYNGSVTSRNLPATASNILFRVEGGDTLMSFYTDTNSFIAFYEPTTLALKTYFTFVTPMPAIGVLDSKTKLFAYVATGSSINMVNTKMTDVGTKAIFLKSLNIPSPARYVVQIGAYQDLLGVLTTADGILFANSTSMVVLGSQTSSGSPLSLVQSDYYFGSASVDNRLFVLSRTANNQHVVEKIVVTEAKKVCFGPYCPQLQIKEASWNKMTKTFVLTFDTPFIPFIIEDTLSFAVYDSTDLLKRKQYESTFYNIQFNSDFSGITGQIKMEDLGRDLVITITTKVAGEVPFFTVYQTYSRFPIYISMSDYLRMPTPLQLTPVQEGFNYAWTYLAIALTVGTAITAGVTQALKSGQFEYIPNVVPTRLARLAELLKFANILQYLLVLNGFRYAIPDSVLQVFLRGPLEFVNIFKMDDLQDVQCEPQWNFSRMGISCNFFNNFGANLSTFVFCVGLWLLCWFIEGVCSTKKRSAVQEVIRKLVWWPRRVFTIALLLDIFDGLQIEFYQFSFTNMRNRTNNAPQITAFVVSILLRLVYAGYMGLQFIRSYVRWRKARGQEITQGRIFRINQYLGWLDFMFDNLAEKDKLPSPWLNFMPVLLHFKYMNVQEGVVWLAFRGEMDQAKFLLAVEAVFAVLSIWWNHYEGYWYRLSYRIRTIGVTGVIVLYLLVDYTKDNAPVAIRIIYVIVLILVYAVLILNELLRIGVEAFVGFRETYRTYKAPNKGSDSVSRDTVGNTLVTHAAEQVELKDMSSAVKEFDWEAYVSVINAEEIPREHPGKGTPRQPSNPQLVKKSDTEGIPNERLSIDSDA